MLELSLLVGLPRDAKGTGHSWPALPTDRPLCFLPQKRNSLIVTRVLKAMLFASRTLKPNTAVNSMFAFPVLRPALERRR